MLLLIDKFHSLIVVRPREAVKRILMSHVSLLCSSSKQDSISNALGLYQPFTRSHFYLEVPCQ